MINEQPSNKEILNAINQNIQKTRDDILNVVQENRQEILNVVQETKKDILSVVEKNQIEVLEIIHNFSSHTDQELTKIKSQMVTKDYLDEKMSDLRGDLVVLVRKEDTKVIRLVEILREKKVLTEADTKSICSMEPFAKLYT